MTAGTAQVLETAEGLEPTDPVVGGMTCAACVNRVEKKPARLEGSRRPSIRRPDGPASDTLLRSP